MSDTTVIERTNHAAAHSTPPETSEAITELVQGVTELAKRDGATGRHEPDDIAQARHELFKELVAWVARATDQGYGPAQIFNWMRSNKWSTEDAMAALLQVLPPAHHREARMLARPAPDPDFTATRDSTVTIDGHTVRVLCESRNPRLVVFGNLLTPKECKELITSARSRLERSSEGGDPAPGTEQTRAGTFFERGETALCARIEARIAALLDWPVEYTERMQVLCHDEAHRCQPRHDYLEPPEGGLWAPVFREGGQRVATLVIHLNTPPQGGSTVFPAIPLEVRAVAGSAVYFAHDKADSSSRTLRGAAPVIEGEKWAAVKWFRQGPTV